MMVTSSTYNIMQRKVSGYYKKITYLVASHVLSNMMLFGTFLNIEVFV